MLSHPHRQFPKNIVAVANACMEMGADRPHLGRHKIKDGKTGAMKNLGLDQNESAG